MSLIFKESFKSSLFSIAGAVIGFITIGQLFPHFLTPEQIGILKLIQSWGMLIAAFFSLGLPLVIMRVFPAFKNQAGHNGLYLLITFISTALCLLLYFCFPLIESVIIARLNTTEFTPYLHLIIPFAAGTVFTSLLAAFITVIKKFSLVALSRDVVQRLLTLAFIAAYISGWTFDEFAGWYAWITFVPFILFTIYALVTGNFSLKIRSSVLVKRQWSALIPLTLYGFAGNLSGILVVSLDSIMIGHFIDSYAVGIYTTLFYFASIMTIPSKSLNKFSNAFITQAFHDEDMAQVSSMHRKIGKTQVILSFTLFIGLLGSTNLVGFILPEKFSVGLWILIISGFAHVLKMSTGNNYQIISLSPKYRISTYFSLIFVCLMVVLNLVFIPKYGIIGAALASLIATAVYSILGSLFLHKHFKITLTDSTYFRLLGYGIIFSAISLALHVLIEHPFIGFIAGALLSSLFLGLVYKQRLLMDFNNLVDKQLSKFRR